MANIIPSLDDDDNTSCSSSSILGGMFRAMTKRDQKWDQSSAMIVRAMYDLGVNLFPDSDSLLDVLSSMFKHYDTVPEAFDVLLSVGAAQVDPKMLFSEVVRHMGNLLVQLQSSDCKEHVLHIEEQFRSLLSVLLRRSGEIGLDGFLSQGKD